MTLIVKIPFETRHSRETQRWLYRWKNTYTLLSYQSVYYHIYEEIILFWTCCVLTRYQPDQPDINIQGQFAIAPTFSFEEELGVSHIKDDLFFKFQINLISILNTIMQSSGKFFLSYFLFFNSPPVHNAVIQHILSKSNGITHRIRSRIILINS